METLKSNADDVLSREPARPHLLALHVHQRHARHLSATQLVSLHINAKQSRELSFAESHTISTPRRAGYNGATADLPRNSGSQVRKQWEHPTAGPWQFREPVGGAAKRAFDVVASAALLLALLPLMIIVALAIRLLYGGPAIIAHPRIGFGGQVFGCLKFRSMVTNGSQVLARYLDENPTAAREWQETQKLRDDPRVTGLGAILRKTSIDELPQLINILLGHMSLVGPRPVVEDELRDKYKRNARHYVRARPGMTGIWQVSGRSSVSYTRRIAMDVLYVQRWSLWMDIRLALMTLPAVLKVKDTA